MPSLIKQKFILTECQIDTKLGLMLAIADERELYLLEFLERRGLEREIERMRTRLNASIIPGKTAPLEQIESEIGEYFEGNLQIFKTPIHLLGTEFQKTVWQELMHIPYGTTRSYGEQAAAIGKKTAYRAVANANGSNQLAIIIPCHRIINSNGELGGYGGGVKRKEWLITLEKTNYDK